MDEVIEQTWNSKSLDISKTQKAVFFSKDDIIFDTRNSLKQNPNGMVFELLDKSDGTLISHTYFSIVVVLYLH